MSNISPSTGHLSRAGNVGERSWEDSLQKHIYDRNMPDKNDPTSPPAAFKMDHDASTTKDYLRFKGRRLGLPPGGSAPVQPGSLKVTRATNPERPGGST